MFDHRRQQIIEMACIRFAEKGFAGTSMRELAADLGLEASSLYTYIQSKDELLEDICFTMGHQLITVLDEVNDVFFNAEEKLRTAIKNHVEVICSNPHASRVFTHEWRHLAPEKKENFIELRNRYEAAFTDILDTGETEQIFMEGDKRFAVLTILSTVNWISEWYNPKGKMKPDEISQKLSDFILTGLKK